LLYNPGTQSAVIPVDFSDFNPGTYQSVESVFDTALTVNLTVVPEPSTLSLVALSELGALLLFGRQNKQFNLHPEKGAANEIVMFPARIGQ
jgi:hypothetical protein